VRRSLRSSAVAVAVVVVVVVVVVDVVVVVVGGSQLSTRCTSCLPCVAKGLSGPSATLSSHCVRYQKTGYCLLLTTYGSPLTAHHLLLTPYYYVLTTCLLRAYYVLTTCLLRAYSRTCVRYQKAAALGKPHRSYWP
jgi:hypothetical protein